MTRKYFDFIRNSWKNLPEKDKVRMGELWKGYEQAVAATYQKYVEASVGTSIENILPFSDERWLPYTFSSSNFVNRAATYTSNQDLSQGVSTFSRYLIKVSWDGGTPVEVNVQGLNPNKTNINEIITKINQSAGFTFATGVTQNSLIKLTSPTIGSNSKITFYETSDPLKNAAEVVFGVDESQLPVAVPEYPLCYELPYDRLESVPTLRDAIRDDNLSVTLVEGADYIIDERYVCFKQTPPEDMWAPRNLFDNEVPWDNFGFLLDIYQKNSQRYIEVLQGLWFAFWTGPRPENLKRALYLLFELPTAADAGTITEVTATNIRLVTDRGVVHNYEIPSGLDSLVIEGQRVEGVQPLVSGIDVFDKINRPGFIETEIGRVGIQRFLTDNATRGTGDTDETKALRLLEEFTFLPQISVNAFIKDDVSIESVRLFLDAIKPVIKTYLFQVIIGVFEDRLGIDDKIYEQFEIDVTPSVDSNETTYQPESVLDDHETSANPGLSVDSEGILYRDEVQIQVYSFGSLIDQFEA